jgi:copper chaperone CopZ
MASAFFPAEKPSDQIAISPPSNLQKLVVQLIDVHCQGCADDIRKFVWEQDGVQSVKVDVFTNQVAVVFEAPFSREKLVRTLKRAEFDLVPVMAPSLIVSEHHSETAISA